jgi:hypothetical protein
MRIHVRPTLAIIAMPTLVLGLWPTLGFWLPGGGSHAFIVAMIALAMAVLATVMPDRMVERGTSPLDVTDLLLINVGLLMLGVNVLSTALSYADSGWALKSLRPVAVAGLAVYLVFMLHFLRVIISPRPEPIDRGTVVRFFVVTLILGFAFRGLVLYASPDPVIDVYTLAHDNADHLLRGKNPYQSDIASPYGTERAYSHGIYEPADRRPAGYPPHSFLAAVPFRLFGGDPRWPNVIGDTLAAVAIFGVAMKRGRPITAYLAATTWLFMPRSAFLMEQAWFEPMLGGLFGVGLWLTEYTGGRKWLGYILIGLALTAKQFGLPLLPAIAWPHRKNWLPLVAGLAVGGLVMLPFYLWSPHDFIDVVLKKHLGRPPQYHSITVASAFFHIGGVDAVPDRAWCWAAALILIGLISLRAPRNGAATALALGTALMVFSTFHTQGFPNYFYLVEYLWLLGALGLLPPAQLAPSAGETRPLIAPQGAGLLDGR